MPILKSLDVSTFEFDSLGLESFAKKLEDFIDTENHFVENSFVLALSSKYGSGKSTFLRMWSSSMAESKAEPQRLVIHLNAWESDYCGDPLYAIVSALAEALTVKGERTEALLEAVKDFGWFSTAIGSQLVNKYTGIDPVVAGEYVEGKKNERLGISVDLDSFSVYEGRKKAMIALKKAISDVVALSSPQTLFLVDELDRCRPDYAILYLETIKHLFDINGAVFILAADRRQLENSAKAAFGPDLDFDEYYRKFIHREVILPAISETGYANLARKYVNYYLKEEGTRFCYMDVDSYRLDDIAKLIAGSKLTPRQIQEVFRTLGHLLETSESKQGNIMWCLGIGSVAMAVFNVGTPNIFHKLGNQQLTPIEAVNFLRQTLGESYVEWWFTLFYTGGGLDIGEEESFDDAIKISGLDVNTAEKDLSQWWNGWGHGRSNRINEIYVKIQHISQWA